jgi:phosphonate transport system permease protein
MNIIEKQYESRQKNWIYQLLILLIIIALLVWSKSAFQMNIGKNNRFKVVQNIILGILHPDTTILFDFSTQGIPYLLFETMCIAFLGTIVGAIISLPFSFLASTNIVIKPIALIGRLFVMAVRTIPVFVYGLMFIRVTGPGPFAGILTMSICSVGMLTKMNIETIEDLDIGILESLDAAGCNTFEKIRYGIIPQLIPNFLSTAIYRFDMNLRDASVLGLVGAGGIGAPLLFAMSSYRWNQVGSILIGLIILILIIELFSTKIRVKLVRG